MTGRTTWVWGRSPGTISRVTGSSRNGEAGVTKRRTPRPAVGWDADVSKEPRGRPDRPATTPASPLRGAGPRAVRDRAARAGRAPAGPHPGATAARVAEDAAAGARPGPAAGLLPRHPRPAPHRPRAPGLGRGRGPAGAVLRPAGGRLPPRGAAAVVPGRPGAGDRRHRRGHRGDRRPRLRPDPARAAGGPDRGDPAPADRPVGCPARLPGGGGGPDHLRPRADVRLVLPADAAAVAAGPGPHPVRPDPAGAHPGRRLGPLEHQVEVDVQAVLDRHHRAEAGRLDLEVAHLD